MWKSRVPLSKSSSLVHTHTCLTHVRSFDKDLTKERIINKRWRKTIPDNDLVPTFYKLNLGGCPHQHSLPVTETLVFSIVITCSNEIQRSVCTTSNRHQIYTVTLNSPFQVRISCSYFCLFITNRWRLVVVLEHLKIKTRLTIEKFASVKGECEI